MGWPRLARPSSLVFWGAASLVTLRFPSHVAAPFYAAAGILFVASCAALAVDRRLRLPLADDLRRYTFTVYLLHVLPVGLLRGLLYPPSGGRSRPLFRRCSSCRASSFPWAGDAWRGGEYPPSRREAVCRSACWVYRIQRLSR